MKRILKALLGGVCLVLWGCSAPDSVETFLRTSETTDGKFVFELDLSDSTATYDIWFYTRVDSPARANLRLRPEWTSPSGQTFSETVYMNPGGKGGAKELYRSGVRVKEPGIWTLNVGVGDFPKRFRGLGLICRRNHNGTRQTS